MVGSHQVLPMMVACALTWSIGSMTNFLQVPVADERRTDSNTNVPPERRRTEATISSPIDHHQQVYFVERGQLDLMDHFSGSWLQPVENFLKMNLTYVNIVEDGCHQAYRQNKTAAQMTVDWLDFSVEHMSKVCTLVNLKS